MTDREQILARVREALRVPAPRPGQHEAVPGRTEQPVSAEEVRRALPVVGASFEDRLNLFRKTATDLKADFHLVNSREEMAVTLLRLKEAEGWKKVGAHPGELTDLACSTLGLPVCNTQSGYKVDDLESCDVGVTQCEALVAQTGSVLVTSRSAGGRALSVLPPHHVVLAERQQLVGDLLEALALLKRKYAGNYPSLISFITGPSRTGDIERILVLGAHGPKKLSIICV
jgi:L-lactate dehydrogenase complex protein LldG